MKLLQSTAIIGGLTLVSRIMGMVRDILIARYLGAGVVSDAFFTAFKLPNVFRRMFAEGAFNAAFVPLYAKRLEVDGDGSADQFASQAASVLFVTVGILVVIFELTMPWTLNLIGFGLDRAATAPGVDIAAYDLAVFYSRMTMPYLLFMSMTALFSGVLNTRGKFALAAAMPILLNLFMISVLAFGPRLGWTQIGLGQGLTIAASLSGLAQMCFIIWGARRAGFKLSWLRPRLSPGMRRLIRLGVPGVISAGITQINILVSHSIATLQASAASWLSYADRLYQLPLGMIGIAMGVALLPSLSRSLRAGNETEATDSINRGIEIAAFLTLPAAVALFMIPEFLIAGLYERGAFTAETTVQVAKALRFFALGLPAFVLIKILTPAFFAREDTRTPMIWAGINAGLNILIGIILFWKIGFSGLALATSIAAWVNVAGLSASLLSDKRMDPDRQLLMRLPAMGVASLIMGAGLYFSKSLFPNIAQSGLLGDLFALVLVAGGGLGLYAVSALALRAVTLRDIRAAFSKG